jgi:hypothetical protein
MCIEHGCTSHTDVPWAQTFCCVYRFEPATCLPASEKLAWAVAVTTHQTEGAVGCLSLFLHTLAHAVTGALPSTARLTGASQQPGFATAGAHHSAIELNKLITMLVRFTTARNTPGSFTPAAAHQRTYCTEGVPRLCVFAGTDRGLFKVGLMLANFGRSDSAIRVLHGIGWYSLLTWFVL